jgi:hydrogenase expression/formation protein HypD
VCVTPNGDIDKAIALALQPEVIMATFGDMIKVPGSRSSLEKAKSEGADVRIVYSTMDALELAKKNSDKAIVFLGIGFETTAPTTAASIVAAQEEAINNYYVFCCHKLTPPVMNALLERGEISLNGIICPGHVSVIIGSQPYESLARQFGIACVVTGFEPVDVLLGIRMLVAQIEEGKPKVEIAYSRAVRPEGNKEALRLIRKVFEPCPSVWRGIGVVEESGLRIRQEYEQFDAEKVFPEIDPGPLIEPKGCICGEVLRGVKTPLDCPLFAKKCNPEHPVGPCMVSSEGSCSTYYHYEVCTCGAKKEEWGN